MLLFSWQVRAYKLDPVAGTVGPVSPIGHPDGYRLATIGQTQSGTVPLLGPEASLAHWLFQLLLCLVR